MSYREKLDIGYGDENADRASQEVGIKDSSTFGLDGKFNWPIRIFTPLLFAGTLLVNYLGNWIY